MCDDDCPIPILYKYFNDLRETIVRETKGLNISLNPQNTDDFNVLSDAKYL